MKKKEKTLKEEKQDPDFQDWYFGLTIGFLLEEIEFNEMLDQIYTDLSESKEREGNRVFKPKASSPLSNSSLSPCR